MANKYVSNIYKVGTGELRYQNQDINFQNYALYNAVYKNSNKDAEFEASANPTDLYCNFKYQGNAIYIKKKMAPPVPPPPKPNENKRVIGIFVTYDNRDTRRNSGGSVLISAIMVNCPKDQLRGKKINVACVKKNYNGIVQRYSTVPLPSMYYSIRNTDYKASTILMKDDSDGLAIRNNREIFNIEDYPGGLEVTYLTRMRVPFLQIWHNTAQNLPSNDAIHIADMAGYDASEWKMKYGNKNYCVLFTSPLTAGLFNKKINDGFSFASEDNSYQERDDYGRPTTITYYGDSPYNLMTHDTEYTSDINHILLLPPTGTSYFYELTFQIEGSEPSIFQFSTEFAGDGIHRDEVIVSSIQSGLIGNTFQSDYEPNGVWLTEDEM